MYSPQEQNDLINILKKEGNRMKKERLNKKAQWLQKMQSGKTYVLYMRYKNKTGVDAYEEIELEGWKNADMIFEMYKGFGHNMKLNHLELSLNGEKIKRVNFNYGRNF